jgi:hypothetical protein
MPSNVFNKYRRRDSEMADQVQRGLSLLYRAGDAEACRFMAGAGISAQVIERVLSAKFVRGARVPVRTVW